MIAGAEQGPVRYGSRYRGTAGGGGPGGSAASAPPKGIGFGEGKPAEERSRPAGEAETWSLPAAPAISRPARLSPSLLPGGRGGMSLFFGEFHGPRRSGATRSGAGATYLPLWEQPGQQGPGFSRHGGELDSPSPAGVGRNGCRTARDPLQAVGGWKVFRGLTSCAHQ